MGRDEKRQDKQLTCKVCGALFTWSAGALLGLSRHTAYKLAHQGVIPTIKMGGQLKVPKVQLERLLNGQPAIATESK
jgi:excisionase family DNA binding protein